MILFDLYDQLIKSEHEVQLLRALLRPQTIDTQLSDSSLTSSLSSSYQGEDSQPEPMPMET
jgi:hypothetical protein